MLKTFTVGSKLNRWLFFLLGELDYYLYRERSLWKKASPVSSFMVLIMLGRGPSIG
jgi:hypothetical protein